MSARLDGGIVQFVRPVGRQRGAIVTHNPNGYQTRVIGQAKKSLAAGR
jgi:hypothetical protein